MTELIGDLAREAARDRKMERTGKALKGGLTVENLEAFRKRLGALSSFRITEM